VVLALPSARNKINFLWKKITSTGVSIFSYNFSFTALLHLRCSKTVLNGESIEQKRMKPETLSYLALI
jgi:hypothetical protein